MFYSLIYASKSGGEMKGGQRGIGPLNPLEVTSTGGERDCNNGRRCNNNGCLTVCLYFHDEKQQSAIRAQVPDIWRTGSFTPTLACISCMQTIPGTHAQLPTRWLEVENESLLLCEELKLTLVYHPSFYRLLSSKIVTSDRFLPVQLLSSWGDRFLVLPTLPYSQNPLILERCVWFFPPKGLFTF